MQQITGIQLGDIFLSDAPEQPIKMFGRLTCASPRPSSMASRLLRSSPDFSWATGGWVQSSSELRSWACSPRSVSRPCMTALVLRTISSWLSRSRVSSRGYTMVDIAWFHTHCRDRKRNTKMVLLVRDGRRFRWVCVDFVLDILLDHILYQLVTEVKRRGRGQRDRTDEIRKERWQGGGAGQKEERMEIWYNAVEKGNKDTRWEEGQQTELQEEKRTEGT